MTVIVVGARKSLLSQMQIKEVLQELQKYYPEIFFENLLVDTYGDKDQITSLRTLGKTDFFTKEIDALLLEGKCRIAVHSAKDLPDPLPKGLSLVAITKGVDPADVLVLRQGMVLDQLPPGALIATSSERREEAVLKLRSDVRFIDLRGTVVDRIVKLEKNEADGVVVAEAALIRLQMTHLNRIRLPGTSTPLQGQLAVMARKEDAEMQQLLACLDVRKHDHSLSRT